MTEINYELALLQTQIAEIERARPVSERIQEIYRQHGVTVTIVFLVAGATIGTMLSVIANVFKTLGAEAKAKMEKKNSNEMKAEMKKAAIIIYFAKCKHFLFFGKVNLAAKKNAL